jgi:hypothetical protein
VVNEKLDLLDVHLEKRPEFGGPTFIGVAHTMQAWPQEGEAIIHAAKVRLNGGQRRLEV